MARSSKVSVIIPTHNRADLLSEAIESVLSQTMVPYEIVVVDDGSTDGTQTLLDDLSGRLSHLKVVRIEFTPLIGRVRNQGVEASSGEILAFLDSDDIWKPNRIERQLSMWDQQPGATLAFCNFHSFTAQGLVPGGPYLAPERRYDGRILCQLLLEPLIVPSTTMVTRDTFESVGPFTDGVIQEDYEFTLAVIAEHNVSYVPDVLVLMREHDGLRARSRAELSHIEYLNIVSRFLKNHPGIGHEEKAAARLGLANVHLKLAGFYIEAGKRKEARKHWAAVARLRPWDRRLPRTFARVLLAPPAPRRARS
jgi:glycosyltransferase involved in cell wall biosynthesis